MHRNPVKDALVQEPEQWPWSSCRSYGHPGKMEKWPQLDQAAAE